MIRTQIYLEESASKKIRSIAAKSGKKQSEVIREAIDQFISSFQDGDQKAQLKRAKGIWKNRNDLVELEQLRSEWERS